MGPRPVTIRTLDPPLHEFLPQDDATIGSSRATWACAGALQFTVESLHEQNPMLGHRGCRLGISDPRSRGCRRARSSRRRATSRRRRARAERRDDDPARRDEARARSAGGVVRAARRTVFARRRRAPLLVGTMIELPRAALLARDIAKTAEFFSFGTNDLTQTTYGISRDDGGKFLPRYLEQKIYADDPFATLDSEGVGR
jgi:pyruvate,orthophosphate dikinase